MFRCLLISFTIVAVHGALTSPTALHAEDSKELKVIVSTSASTPYVVRLPKEDSGVVIRSAEDLVAHSPKSDSAKELDVQKAMMADLTKFLMVPSIDWDKQMLLVVQGQGTRSEYGTIKFGPPKIEGKVLTITFKQENRVSLATTQGPPMGFLLVERFEGEVKFVPPTKK